MNKQSDAMLVVKVENASKRFRQGKIIVEALKNVSLEVSKGDFTAIMGASGSGKSTLLHLIAGLTRPESGKVTIEGQNISEMSDSKLTAFRRKKIGLVFQAFNLVPTLTAEENILLPANADGRGKEALSDLRELTIKLGLLERLKHYPDAMSGGEQQRTAIARALINQPAILLADEPTGSLDSVNGQKLCRLLREFSDKDGRTILLVTHEPSVAIWAKKIMVLKDGAFINCFETKDFKDAHSLASHYQAIVEKQNETETAA